MTSTFRLKVIVCSYNCPDFLAQCLRSLEMQNFRAFDVYVVDDASTDPKQREVIEDYCQRNGWQALFHQERLGQLYSMVDAIERADCQDEDVICVLDGDDWLAREDSLEIVHDSYLRNDAWVTYGSIETFPPGGADQDFLSQELPPEVISQKTFRQFPWLYVHMHTFKAFLWKAVKNADLRDEDGDYYRVSGDQARFFPLLEMAGTHIYRIPETIYIYNMANPLNDHKVCPEEQARIRDRVRSQPPYPSLER